VKLLYDTLDAPTWPTRGGRGLLRYNERLESLGSDTDSSDVELRATWAWSLGRNTIVPGAELGLAREDAGATRGFPLGGVFRLSGLEPDELIGQEFVLGRVIFYHQLNRRRFRLLSPGWYVGCSLEAGNVFDGVEPVTGGNLIGAGSIFIAADTVVGPLQLGWGLAEGDRSRVYLSLGRSYF
jgi:NTE family protein